MYAAMLQQINRSAMESRLSTLDSTMVRETVLKHKDACISEIDKTLIDKAKSEFILMPRFISAFYQIPFEQLSHVPNDNRDYYIMSHPSIGELIEQLKTKFTGCVVGTHHCIGANMLTGVEFTVTVKLHP